MAEHTSKGREDKAEVETKHSLRRAQSQPVYEQVGEFGQTIETPFRPRSEEHAALLADTQSAEQRAELALHLQRTYGNAYVQRLIASKSLTDEALARPAIDEEGTLSDRIREQKPPSQSGVTIERERSPDSHVSRTDGSTAEAPWETSETDEVCYAPPDITAIAADSTVEGERAADWAAGESDYAERFAWITWDEYTDEFSVVGKATGDEFGVTPAPKPADNPPVYRVGEYHQHPPLTPAMQTDVAAGRASYPIGPSAEDETAAQADDSPGLVRDYTDETRTTVTDYDYGPTQRTF